MRLGGDIDEAELRKIKAVLGKTSDADADGQLDPALTRTD
jgi:hypothetical protein